MKIAITADNTCDLPEDLIKENNISLIYIPIIMGDTEYRQNIDSDVIYDYVAKTNVLPKTSALSTFEYKEIFEKKLKDFDAVIHFSLGFKISSTGNNAYLASKQLKNVYVIDTKSLSTGSGLLILSCLDKIKQGKDAKQIAEELQKEADKVQASFIISKLNYLKKGGRCSSIAVFGANLLGLKVLVELIDGSMKATKKYIGKIDKVLSKYLTDMITKYPPDNNRVFVTSSSKMPGIKELLVNEVKKLNFKEVLVSCAGPTISSHCGPGTIGVLYIKK